MKDGRTAAAGDAARYALRLGGETCEPLVCFWELHILKSV